MKAKGLLFFFLYLPSSSFADKIYRGEVDEVLKLYEEMQKRGVSTGPIITCVIIDAYSRAHNLEGKEYQHIISYVPLEALKWLEKVKDEDKSTLSRASNSILHAYGSKGKLSRRLTREKRKKVKRKNKKEENRRRKGGRRGNEKEKEKKRKIKEGKERQ